MKEIYNHFQERFEAFKKITDEEYVIASLIKGAIDIDNKTELLGIGGGSGFVSSLIQPYRPKCTILDIEHYGHSYPFIKGRWEDVGLSGYFDLVLVSHIYGKFEKVGTSKPAFEKAKIIIRPEGNLILCYNQVKGKTADLLYDLAQEIHEGLIDFFDESLLPSNKKEIPFSVQLVTNSFDELSEYVQVFLELPDDIFNKYKPLIREKVKKFSSDYCLEVSEKIVIMSNTWGV